MTRINTNVSSLNAQKTLARSNNQLQEALTRLSTGLRINSGKDDPAGLIASETLRSDIVSTQVAITNSERANQMIATADSALGQVSTLLNDVRGLVSEAANVGAMSSEQIAANQLQVDSSLEAIDRIAQVTQFQGKRLLDGSLDFLTENVDSTVSDLQIQQANFGTQSEISVDVNVVAQAEKGSLTYASNSITSDVVLEVGGANGFEAFNFASGSTIAEMASAINLVSDALGITATVDSVLATSDGTGSMELSSVGTDNSVGITAVTAGATGGDIAIKYVLGPSDTLTDATYAAAVGDDPATITVNLAATQWTKASNDQTTGSEVYVELGGDMELNLTADIAGEQFNDMTIVVIDDAANSGASYDYGTNTMYLTANVGVDDGDAVAALINNDLGHLFTATVNDAGTGAGALVANTYLSQIGTAAGFMGSDGGVINATAADVQSAIDTAASAYVTATGTGAGKVTMLSDYAYLGSMNTGTANDLNNHIQLVGPSLDALPINTVNNGASKALQIDFQENRATGGYAQVIVQGTDANASFKVTANNKGTEYDGAKIRFYDTSLGSQADGVAWDAESKEIRIYSDFTDTNEPTAAAIATMINDDIVVGGLFTAEVFGSDGSAQVDALTAGSDSVVATLGGGQLYDAVNIQLATDSSGNITTTAAQLIDFINTNSSELADLGISASNAGSSTGTGLMAAQSTEFATVGVTRLSNEFATGTTYAQNGVNAQLTVSALTAGSGYEGVKITFRDRGTDDISVAYDSAAKELNIYVDGTDSVNDVVTAFTASSNPTEYAMFQLEAAGTGADAIKLTDTGVLSGGTTTTGTSKGVAMVGNWDEGDVLGTAGLQFESLEYGSNHFVSVKALEGTFDVVDAANVTKTRDSGTDINVRLNGIQAIGEGLKASINTSALDMSFALDASVTAGTVMNFSITGGGAQFQLGPDVVSNQQARMGIGSVNTSKLGGTSGQLFMIRSGGDYDLDTDTKMAAKIVEEAITSVTTLRGRLGAFQSTTLQANIDVLNDTLEGLTEAESSIRDADFAAESANLTRAQILVQSGISVLSMANQNPQNVLSLLR